MAAEQSKTQALPMASNRRVAACSTSERRRLPTTMSIGDDDEAWRGLCEYHSQSSVVHAFIHSFIPRLKMLAWCFRFLECAVITFMGE